jgi:cytochrome d ubiquinol oxidase subunit II
MANIPLQLKKGNYRYAFLSSSLTIACLLSSIAVEIFPNLLRASNDASLNITIDNAASSRKTMETLLIIAAIGTPLVGLYTGFVFWTFKGKVKMDETSL